MRDVKFDLHPWELVPKRIGAVGEVAFEVDLEDRICQVRRTQSHHEVFPYFRFVDAPAEHFVLVYPNEFRPMVEPIDFDLDLFSIRRAPQNEEESRQTFGDTFYSHSWGRVFCLDADLNCIRSSSDFERSKWWFLMLANGKGVFARIPHSNQEWLQRRWHSNAPFRWHDSPHPEMLRARTAAMWLEWLKEEMQQRDSTVRFAHDIALLSEIDANFQCTHWKNGHRTEWENVSRWILQTENRLWDSYTREVKWFWQIGRKSPEEHLENGHMTRVSKENRDAHRADALKRLRLMARYFAPELDAGLIKRHLCVEYHRNGRKTLIVKIQAPSAHEQLEAALNLKAWAQGKFSAEEIEILCAI